ncbi:MAG: hypothetical protein ABEK17_00725 [Candidatus Aenigmatarchaeota archaeon]
MKSILSKRGQMSLEMIIGLVILLVVAAVVINIFITKVNVDNLQGPPEQKLAKDEFKNNCESLCKKYQNEGTLEYCRTFYQGNDWDLEKKDDIINVVKVGEKNWDVCEDRVYCFHAVPCNWGTGELTMSDCKALFCQAYSEKYNGNLTMATKALKDDIRMSDDLVCKQKLDQIPAMDNWYKSRFANGNFCGSGGGIPQSTTTTTGGGNSGPTLSCQKTSSSSIKCSWSNCEGTGNVLAGQGVRYMLNTKSGEHEFTNLNSGSHTFVISCTNGEQITQSPINL